MPPERLKRFLLSGKDYREEIKSVLYELIRCSRQQARTHKGTDCSYLLDALVLREQLKLQACVLGL